MTSGVRQCGRTLIIGVVAAVAGLVIAFPTTAATDLQAGTNDRLGYVGANGSTSRDRLGRLGYSQWAENIAQFPSAQQAVKFWSTSRAHRASMLNCRFRDTGLAVARSHSGRLYWTQTFVAPTKFEYSTTHIQLRQPQHPYHMSKILTPTLLNTHPLVEEILDSHQDHARGDERGWSSYRGHVYRVFNMARALVPDTDHRDDKLAIAAAFHDIDVFTSLNYLGLSVSTMDAWLRHTGRDVWGEELAVIVAKHHHLTPYRGRHATLTEAFRRADLVDLSQGLIRVGMPRGHVRAVRTSIDVGCFFTRTVPRAIVRHLIRHPLDPLPITRARRALKQAGYGGADR